MRDLILAHVRGAPEFAVKSACDRSPPKQIRDANSIAKLWLGLRRKKYVATYVVDVLAGKNDPPICE